MLAEQHQMAAKVIWSMVCTAELSARMPGVKDRRQMWPPDSGHMVLSRMRGVTGAQGRCCWLNKRDWGYYPAKIWDICERAMEPRLYSASAVKALYAHRLPVAPLTSAFESSTVPQQLPDVYHHDTAEPDGLTLLPG